MGSLFYARRPPVVACRIVGQLSDLRCYPSLRSVPAHHHHHQQWLGRRTLSKARPSRADAPSAAATLSQAPTEPTQDTHPELSLADQVRLMMRRVPYPVAIITATDPHESPVEKAFRGMTVSSFNTVTLSPEPVISFNVKRPSETLTALQSSGRFLVHLLAPGPAPAALARDFSRGNHNLTIVSGNSGDYEFVSHTPTTPVGETSSKNLRLLPLLQRKKKTTPTSPLHTATDHETVSKDFPFVFECRLLPHSVDIHDHTIVVGTVVRALSAHLNSPDATSKATTASDLCLTYANTRFWAMGHKI